MATAKGKTIKTEHFETPVIDGREHAAELRRKIADWERAYGVSSAEMDEMVESDQVDETEEIFEWMSDYHVLAFLERETPTVGTPTTTTESSTQSS